MPTKQEDQKDRPKSTENHYTVDRVETEAHYYAAKEEGDALGYLSRGGKRRVLDRIKELIDEEK